MHLPRLSSPKYRPDIDGLRAIAVLSVVAFHASPRWLPGGFTGVDVFFVISGYLISTIILENIDQRSFSFLSFYARRIGRIFPALIIVLGTCYFIGWHTLFDNEFKQLGKHIAAGTIFASNFILWGESGYFDNASESKPLLHLWSLGIEEQFYLLWPLALWLLQKLRTNALALIVLLACVSFNLNLRDTRLDAVAAFYSLHTRLWELLCGSILAWVTVYHAQWQAKILRWLGYFCAPFLRRNPPEKPEQLGGNILSFVGVLLLIWGFINIQRSYSFPGVWALVPVVSTTLIIAAGPLAWINRTILSTRLAVWIGLISFPLYLWHWPLLSFARIMQDTVPGIGIRLAAIALSVLLSWLTYRLVERPLHTSRPGVLKIAVLGSIMITTGVVGFDAYRNERASNRFAHMKAQTALIANPYPPIKNGFLCNRQIRELDGLEFDGYCTLTKAEPPSIAFIGDSHIVHYRNAVFEMLRTTPVLMAAQTSCLPFAQDAITTASCRRTSDAITRYLEHSESIRTVVLSGYWAYLMTGGFSGGGINWRTPDPLTEEEVAQFTHNARAFIFRMLSSGKHVILMKDIPAMDFDVNSCVDARPLRLTSPPSLRKDCWIRESASEEHNRPYDKVMDRILGDLPQIEVFDPKAVLCQDGKCRAMDSNGMPLYANGDHLNAYGAKLVIGALLESTNVLR